jgi:hypothetical protein
VLGVLAATLFIRGVGLSGIGVPSISAAYASVRRADLPMETTALNVVQRLGGPTLTTLYATFLAWRLRPANDSGGLPGAFTAAFVLLCALHAVLFVAALRLPLSVEGRPSTNQSNRWILRCYRRLRRSPTSATPLNPEISAQLAARALWHHGGAQLILQ